MTTRSGKCFSQDQEFKEKLQQAREKVKSLSSAMESCRRTSDWYLEMDESAEQYVEELAEAGYEYWILKKQQQGCCCQCECHKK